MNSERIWEINDTKEVLKILSPFGINLIQDFSNKDDLIFKCDVPKESKIKKSNKFVKGDFAGKFVKSTIDKYRKNNNIVGSYGIDFEELDSTWTEENKKDVEKLLVSFS